MVEGPLSPEEVAHRGFGTSFRGFDTDEVRNYLQRVATELRAGTARERELNRRLADAEHRAANPVLDRETLTKALGEEMARILATAQSAATELRAKAEENAARILREAHEQAQQIRAKAEVILAERTEEADQEAAEIRRAAESDAAGLVERARLEAAAAIADVEARTRHVVQEAQVARARVVGDLTRRRKALQGQVEQLRAGRERLLEAYRVVRRTTDEVADELQKVEAEARDAAIKAGERAAAAADHHEELEDVLAAFAGQPEGAAEPSVADAPAPPVTEAEAAEGGDPSAAGDAPARPAGDVPDATPPAPATPPSAHQAEPGDGGRRSPTLRLLRRPREGRPARQDVAGAPEADEGVRIIGTRPGTGTAAPAPEPPAPAPTEAAPPGAAAAAEGAEGGEGAEEHSPPAPLAPATAEGLAPATEAPEPAPAPVDELFARIRAGREDAVARAHEVLAGPPGAAPAAAPSGDTAAAPPAAPAEGVAITTPATDEEALLQRRDRAVEGLEVRLARKLKRALQDEQNEVLDRLRSSRTAGPEGVLPPSSHQADRYRRAAEEQLQAAAAAGAAFVAPGSQAAPAVADLAGELGASLSEPLRRALERALDAEAGTDHAVLVERIGAAYRECKVQRIEGLAGDAATAAFCRGALAAMAPGTPVRWVVDDDGRPCPDCDDNALAGPTPAGEAFPTGQSHPPAHAGCRCLLTPAEVAAAANGAP